MLNLVSNETWESENLLTTIERECIKAEFENDFFNTRGTKQLKSDFPIIYMKRTELNQLIITEVNQPFL